MLNNISIVQIDRPKDDLSVNVVLGQSHFMKTVEDVHEALVNSVPNIKFGLAFCEASGDKKIRYSSTDKEMEKLALVNAKKINAGHSFIIFLKDVFPINVLNSIKLVPEVCCIYCATANPLQVLIMNTEQGRGIIGVVDGESRQEVETKKDIEKRVNFLRKIGYKQ
jgi:uncharacterized protein